MPLRLLALCKLQLAGLGLQDGNKVTRPDVGFILKLFLLGQISLRTAICQFVNACLKLGICPQLEKPVGHLRSQTVTNGFQHPVKITSHFHLVNFALAKGTVKSIEDAMPLRAGYNLCLDEDLPAYGERRR